MPPLHAVAGKDDVHADETHQSQELQSRRKLADIDPSQPYSLSMILPKERGV